MIFTYRIYQDVGIAKTRNVIFVCIADKFQTNCIAHFFLQTHRPGQNHEPAEYNINHSQEFYSPHSKLEIVEKVGQCLSCLFGLAWVYREYFYILIAIFL